MTENYQQCAGDRVSLVSLGCFKSSPLNSHYAAGRNINRWSISEEQRGRNSIVGPYPRNILELMHRGLLSWNFTLEQKKSCKQSKYPSMGDWLKLVCLVVHENYLGRVSERQTCRPQARPIKSGSKSMVWAFKSLQVTVMSRQTWEPLG